MDAIEKRICQLIDENQDKLYAFAEDIYCHGERGYSEFRTAEKTAAFLKELGLSVQEGLAITGVKGRMEQKEGPTVAIIGELDGILCSTHPQAVPETGLSHACGHHAQLTAMLGATLALADEEVRKSLDGNVVAFAVPAEEYQAAHIREELLGSGKVCCLLGKSELLRLGEFDDIDMALSNHTHMIAAGADCDLLLGNSAATGYIGKTIIVHGKGAHAAAAPHAGINALNAAALGLSALGMVRETFQEKDNVRVHPVVREGGQAVNNVPDRAVLDMMVRAITMDAMQQASKKVDRAFEGGAWALGATTTVENTQGALPVLKRPADKVMKEAAALLEGVVVKDAPMDMNNTASTDLGDLTHRMPVLNFTFGGFVGKLHGDDFKITDPYKMYLAPAKLMALTIYRLLKDQAQEAKAILDDFTPALTKQEYLDYIESMRG